ncbi:MAG: pentapeptide repeat-containing protein [Planctomycetota bacterium]
MTDIDFCGVDFCGVDFWGVDFWGVDFWGVDFWGVDFWGDPFCGVSVRVVDSETTRGVSETTLELVETTRSVGVETLGREETTRDVDDATCEVAGTEVAGRVWYRPHCGHQYVWLEVVVVTTLV